MSPRSVPTVAEESRPALIDQIARIKALLATSGKPTQPVTEAPSTLMHLAKKLGLSAFECDVLMLTAAVELDAEAAALVADRNGGDSRPSFALALAVLPDPHWDALTPERPLRRWGLVELGVGAHLTSRPLSVDEHILHHLTGLADATILLDGLARTPYAVTLLTESQGEIAEELVATSASVGGPILIRLEGADTDARRAVAHRVAQLMGRELLEVCDGVLPEHTLSKVATVLDREAMLGDRVLLTDHPGLLGLLECPIVVSTADAEQGVPDQRRSVLTRSCPLPDVAEQLTVWANVIPSPSEAVQDAINQIAHHYRLSARAVQTIAAEWSAAPTDHDESAADLRRLARERSRVGLGSLAERIETRATSEDLVLPPGQKAMLDEIARHLRFRGQVYDDWGFAEKSARGLGITALFAGESGTGKTMAAETIARTLDLDLFRVDLAQVVSKYIGETEKQLARLFDRAESSGAVLLFDEADALFGKRTEVRDSHDRYANLEVSYLLARMESYRGLAILTTNLRSNVDSAFTRRLRFVIQFPFPDEASRAEIWRRTLPDRAPTEGLDFNALARLQVPGGSIRSIAVAAAFAAADDQSPIRPEHILHAATIEYAKAERSLTSTEVAALAGRP